MVETIFSTPFAQAILVFILVFVVVFAILQKTKLFGEGKKQIDALVGLAVGLIAVFSTGYAKDLISNLIPFLAVALIVILVFLILLGSFFAEGKFDVPGWLKVILGIIVFIAVVIAVLFFSGAWDTLSEKLTGNTILNGVFIVIIAAVIVAVVLGGGKSKNKE